MTILILGIVIFLGVHLVQPLASGLRRAVMARGGKGLWHALHGICSILGIALIAYGFDASRPSEVLYVAPFFLLHLTLTLMLIASICLAAQFFPAGKIKAVTKFPAVLAIKIWALAHLLSNGELNSVLLFGTFLIWAVMLRISMKKRVLAGERVLPVFVSYSYDIAAIVVGTLVYGLVVWKLHALLIGVQPIALPF
ncbi:NnrU family protein [Pararhizobium sp.]|uniref:NnrU family protein n=1 Tax=Pararhizobium sp. TaxID=1977563 RepID=UPI00271AA2A0|nr:NnrU family protein [Pararhizobium sp.]MDO9414887.1 NnrU family protein [Pararhizobium sp.]